MKCHDNKKPWKYTEFLKHIPIKWFHSEDEPRHCSSKHTELEPFSIQADMLHYASSLFSVHISLFHCWISSAICSSLREPRLNTSLMSHFWNQFQVLLQLSIVKFNSSSAACLVDPTVAGMVLSCLFMYRLQSNIGCTRQWQQSAETERWVSVTRDAAFASTLVMKFSFLPEKLTEWMDDHLLWESPWCVHSSVAGMLYMYIIMTCRCVPTQVLVVFSYWCLTCLHWLWVSYQYQY